MPKPGGWVAGDLCARFLSHARVYYRRADGSITQEPTNYLSAVRALAATGDSASLSAVRFRAADLRAVRETMVAQQWSRKTVNA